MLPDADDFSSPPPELAGYAAVADHVFLAFAVPKGAVSFRPGVALGAGAPTASAVMRRNVKCQDVTPIATMRGAAHLQARGHCQLSTQLTFGLSPI